MMQTLEFTAMNTSVMLAADSAGDVASGMNAAREFIENAEVRFSRFLPESEVSRLNQSAGEWYSVSEDLMEILELSLGYCNETGGLFDPSILPALKRAGYDKSMDEIHRHGASPLHEAGCTPQPDFRQVEIDSGARRVRLPHGMELDLGGIAKGWIVEHAVMKLENHARACAVSAGGDIVFRGNPAGEAGWQVDIEDPLDPNASVLGLRLGPCAVATSSIVKRSWQQGGLTRHHLIDPRTAEPAIADALSVTVVSPTISMSEVYAKALLIGGDVERPRLASKRPELSYYVVRSDGTVVSAPASEEYADDIRFIHTQ